MIIPVCNPPIIKEPQNNLQNCLRWVFQNEIFTPQTVTDISVNIRARNGFEAGADIDANNRQNNGELIRDAVIEILGAAPYCIEGIIEDLGEVPDNDVIYMSICAALRREEDGEAWDLHFNRLYTPDTMRGASGGDLRNNIYDQNTSILTVQNAPIVGNLEYANGVTFLLIPIQAYLEQGCDL